MLTPREIQVHTAAAAVMRPAVNRVEGGKRPRSSMAPNFGSTNGPTFLERVPGGWRGGADPRRAGIAAGDQVSRDKIVVA